MNKIKKCTECQEIKTLSNFGVRKDASDGLMYQCKQCVTVRRTIIRGQPLYTTFRNVLDRCNNPKNPQWHNYGGRGIKTDSSFDTYELFFSTHGHLFLAAQEEFPDTPPEKLQIDRIDNNQGYVVGNIRWVPAIVNANNKRNNVSFMIAGISRTYAQWAAYEQ